MFLGWYDPDKKKPARAKLAAAIDRYEEKFGRVPRFCLTSAQDAHELAQPTLEHPDVPVEVHARGYIARYTMYIGEEGA